MIKPNTKKCICKCKTTFFHHLIFMCIQLQLILCKNIYRRLFFSLACINLCNRINATWWNKNHLDHFVFALALLKCFINNDDDDDELIHMNYITTFIIIIKVCIIYLLNLFYLMLVILKDQNYFIKQKNVCMANFSNYCNWCLLYNLKWRGLVEASWSSNRVELEGDFMEQSDCDSQANASLISTTIGE